VTMTCTGTAGTFDCSPERGRTSRDHEEEERGTHITRPGPHEHVMCLCEELLRLHKARAEREQTRGAICDWKVHDSGPLVAMLQDRIQTGGNIIWCVILPWLRFFHM